MENQPSASVTGPVSGTRPPPARRRRGQRGNPGRCAGPAGRGPARYRRRPGDQDRLPRPQASPADLAARSGRPEYEAERSHLNAVGYGVRLDDYAVEYVGSASGSAHDLVGGFLAEHSGGPGIFATVYRVRDLSAARAALTAADVRFTPWGRHSLLLRVESSQFPRERRAFA